MRLRERQSSLQELRQRPSRVLPPVRIHEPRWPRRVTSPRAAKSSRVFAQRTSSLWDRRSPGPSFLECGASRHDRKRKVSFIFSLVFYPVCVYWIPIYPHHCPIARTTRYFPIFSARLRFSAGLFSVSVGDRACPFPAASPLAGFAYSSVEPRSSRQAPFSPPASTPQITHPSQSRDLGVWPLMGTELGSKRCSVPTQPTQSSSQLTAHIAARSGRFAGPSRLASWCSCFNCCSAGNEIPYRFLISVGPANKSAL